MASGIVLDPIRLLRLAPLITSTASAIYSSTELIVNAAFLQPSIRPKSNQVLPHWFSHVFNRGATIVVTLITLTTSATLANIYSSYQQHGQNGFSSLPFSTKMYGLGVTLALSHLAFIPLVSKPIQHLLENSSKRGACDEMEDWLRVHRIRWAVADFPACIAFIIAVLTIEGPI